MTDTKNGQGRAWDSYQPLGKSYSAKVPMPKAGDKPLHLNPPQGGSGVPPVASQTNK